MKARHTGFRSACWILVFTLLAFTTNSDRKASPMTTRSSREGLIKEPSIVGGFDEDIEQRDDWFYFQRAYPFGEIPAGARQRAWLSRPPNWRAEAEILAAEESLNWKSIGPRPTLSAVPDNWGVTSGRINCIAVSPSNANLVLIGGSTGGIWSSTDAGVTFVPVSDNEPSLAVGSIAFSKQNPNIVYAGMGDYNGSYIGSGVLKSTDAGQTWSRVNNTTLSSACLTSKIEIDPENSDRVYLAQYAQRLGNTLFSSGFQLSTDGGVNWSQKIAGLPRDIAIDPADANTIYLGMSRNDSPGGGPAGLFRSTDRGETWANIYPTPYPLGSTSDVRVAIASPQIIYVYAGGFLNGVRDLRVVVSTDGGASWDNRGRSGLDAGQFGYNTYIAVKPGTTDTIYVGTRDVFMSTNRGGSYTNLTANLSATFQFNPSNSTSHIDQHALAFSPADPNVVYIANDGGISKSTDGGRRFSSLNSSLSLTQFYNLSIHPADPSVCFGGAQDNGLQQSSGLQWREITTGDFGSVIFNPQDLSMFVSNYVNGTIIRFTEGGADARTIATESTFGESSARPRIAFIAPLTGAGGNLYFGTWRLFISRNFGDAWEAPAGMLDLTKGVTGAGSDVLSVVSVAHTDTNVIYTGSSQGRAMISTNGGSTWSDITAGLPNRFISDIFIDPSNSSNAYLTLSGFVSSHVFKTTNAGATWSDISGNLPDVPANAITIDPADPNTLYVGTDIGVFRSSIDGGNWATFGDGLPPVVVTAFATDPIGVINAATYGRGAYQLRSSAIPLPLISSVTQQSKKKLRIDGMHFGIAPRVLINSIDRTDKITGSSPTQLTLKGKPKKLGLVDGDNLIKVVSGAGDSNIFTLIR